MRMMIMVIALLFANDAQTQSPPLTQWQYIYGGSNADVGYCISATSDGGYVATSTTQSSDGDVTGHQGGIDVWVTKLNVEGLIEWQRCYGGSLSEPYSNTILEAPGGGYMVGSTTFSYDGDITCPAKGGRIWLVRIDASGEVIWDLCPAGVSSSSIGSITTTSDGDWLICGGTWAVDQDGCGNGQMDLWMARVSDSGQVLWSRCYGGSHEDRANHVTHTSDGGFVLTGSSRSNDGDLSGVNPYSMPPAPASTGWVLKVDAEGSQQWQHCYGGSMNDHFTMIQEAVDGSFWVLGITQSNDGHVSGNNGSEDGWVLRLDSNGELLDQRCVGGSGNDRMYDLHLLDNGSVVTSGYTFSDDGDVTEPIGLSDAWIMELDPDLSLVWEQTYGGTDHDLWNSIERAPDGGVVLLGNSYSNDGDLDEFTNHGSADVWLLKLAPWEHTGVEDAANATAGIQLYPNPTAGTLQVAFGGLHGEGWQLQIMDALARVVHTTATVYASQTTITLSTHALAPGTYALRLHRNGEAHVRRFVKQ